MTRKEQIEQEADKFAGVNYDCETEADTFYHAVQKEAFVAGAVWADEHPSEEIQRLKTMFESDPDAYEQGYKDAIGKACEFLLSYRQDTPDGLGYIAGIVNDKTIEDFKKYMEE